MGSRLQNILRSHAMLAVLYGASLLMGLLVALPAFSTLRAEAGNSLAFLQLMPGFNYTVYSDFMAQSGKAISPLLSVGRWMGLASLLLSVFFAGGILYRISQPGASFRMVDFWQTASTYFKRYLGLLGVNLLFIFSGGIIWLVIGGLVMGGFEDRLTERGLILAGLFFFTLFVLVATLILCIGDYAKVLMFREDETNAFRAFGLAARLVGRNLFATYGRYLLLIAAGTVLFGVYFLLDDQVGMVSWRGLLFMIVVQQLFILSRIILKVWNLAVVYAVYCQLKQPLTELTQPGEEAEAES